MFRYAAAFVFSYETEREVLQGMLRQTAAAAAKLGLRCMALLEEPAQPMDEAFYRSGNLMLDRWFGCELKRVRAGTDVNAALVDLEARLRRDGFAPYTVPVGGSNALGAV